MSEEQLKAFIAKVKEDKALQAKLNTAEGFDEIILIAKEAGYSINEEDLSSARSNLKELSERELENVAGGWVTMDYKTCDCTGLFSCLIKVCAKF